MYHSGVALTQGPAAPPPPKPKPKEDDAEDDSKFDDFMGADTALLAGTTGEYDKDDKEADAIWAKVDDFMDDRRRVCVCSCGGRRLQLMLVRPAVCALRVSPHLHTVNTLDGNREPPVQIRTRMLEEGVLLRIIQDRREARLKEEIEKYRAENPKITEQFADLKRKLAGISDLEWEAIPEIGDYTIKNKRPRFESFTPVPDTLLAAAAAEKQTNSTADAGLETPAGYATTDLTAIGEGRETVRESLRPCIQLPQSDMARSREGHRGFEVQESA